MRSRFAKINFLNANPLTILIMEALNAESDSYDLEFKNYFEEVVKLLIEKIGDKHNNGIYIYHEKISAGYRIYLNTEVSAVSKKNVTVIISFSKVITVNYCLFSKRSKRNVSIDEILPDHFNPFTPQRNKVGLCCNSFSKIIIEIIDYLTSNMIPIKSRFEDLYL